MTDWLENFSDNIEKNAGAYAALGGLAALNNQRQQINKLAELQKAQAQAANTEQDRLAVEQQRLELEKARIEEERATAAAVKQLRRLMADTGSVLNRIEAKYSVQKS
jgi:membrane-bound lytic murein transglycosylase B